MGGALRRLFSGPSKVLKRLAGIVAAFIVMSQFAQMIVESLAVKRLHRHRRPLMKHLAAFDQQGVVGNLLSESVLEGVLDAGCRLPLVDELARLQDRQHLLQLAAAGRSHLSDHRDRRLPPDHRYRLQQFLLLSPQPIYARGQYALHRRRQPHLRQLARRLHCPIPHQRALVEQGLHHLLDEERIALGALDDHAFERVEFHAFAQQRREHLPCALPSQRIQSQLRVVALVTPFMAVLGSIVDQ